MKLRLTAFSAAIFILTGCDGEKVQEAKKETVEAAKATGEAAKEVAVKGVEKAKEIGRAAGDKLKSATSTAKEAISEKGGPALEAFKARIAGLSEHISSLEGKAGTDPGKMTGLLESVVTKAKGIPDEGLPEDLKAAFHGYNEAMNRLLQFVKTIPKDERAYSAWELQNVDRLKQFGDAATHARKLLEETAAKHGVTGLNLGE